MTRRRSFLIGCGGVIAAPVLAHVALRTKGAVDDASVTTGLPVAASPHDIALRIDGWEATSDTGTDVWVQINSSWRANWR